MAPTNKTFSSPPQASSWKILDFMNIGTSIVSEIASFDKRLDAIMPKVTSFVNDVSLLFPSMAADENNYISLLEKIRSLLQKEESTLTIEDTELLRSS